MSVAQSIAEGGQLVLGDGQRIFTSFGKNYGYPYKVVIHSLQKVREKYWRFDLGYAFDVENGMSGSGFNLSNFYDPTKTFSQFKLQINPQALQQSEDFSINVTPCQTGVVVEHQGFVTKQLTIAGTTGLNPVPGGRSGYAEMLHLRNYFRSYAELKKDPTNKDMRLIFRNKKDNEHWYVEPVGPGVVTRRKAGKPFLYDYSIHLLIVGKASPYKRVFGAFNDVLDSIDEWEGYIDDAIQKIQDAASLIRSVSDVGKNIWNDFTLVVLQPMDNVVKVLESMKYAKSTYSALPKKFYDDLKSRAKEVRDSSYDLVGKGSTSYNNLTGRTAMQPLDVPSDKYYTMAEGANKLVIGLDKVLSSNMAFSAETGVGGSVGASSDLDTAIELNSSEIQMGRSNSYQSISNYFNGGVNYIPPSSVRTAVIEYNDTLEKLAFREIGNPVLWYQIVLLNNLDPPYFSEAPLPGKRTLKYGDTILIPVYSSQAKRQQTTKNTTEKITEGMTIYERNLGVDLLLTNDNDVACDTYASDLRLVSGMPNLGQAVKINIGLEKGSLLYHPEKGINAHVGDKNSASAQDILESIEESLSIDPRIQSVEDISVVRDQSILRLDLHVTPAKLDQPIPLQVELEGGT